MLTGEIGRSVGSVAKGFIPAFATAAKVERTLAGDEFTVGVH